jgi:E1A/CREB-binding protein
VGPFDDDFAAETARVHLCCTAGFRAESSLVELCFKAPTMRGPRRWDNAAAAAAGGGGKKRGAEGHRGGGGGGSSSSSGGSSEHMRENFVDEAASVGSGASAKKPCARAEEEQAAHGQMKEGTSLVNTFPDHLIQRHIVLTKMQPVNIGVNACKLCGGGQQFNEPPTFYCNGTCSQRIRRNAWYHATPDNKSHWCVPCFGEIKGAEVTAGDKTVKKSEMKMLKHNKMSEESRVQCETCERWVHMICGLFNNRFNDQNTKYHCPSCVLEKRVLGDSKFSQQPAAGGAKGLPRTHMSDHLEKFLHEYLRDYQREKAKEDKCKPEDVQSAEGLTVRVCSVLKKTCEVEEQFLARYKDKGYPAKIAYVSKGMLVFQNIDGIDVIIFGMYVHEFGDDAPEPNKRRVYLSYLDSVKYMQPAHLRTKVYHAILIAYIGWIKKLGYHTCHIWACPPMKGDDYILYQKPEDQKNPKPDRLRKWYIVMLDIAKEYGYVDSLTNLVKDCFVDNSDKRPFSATVLPYFEGDYWVGVAEDHLTKIKEEKEAEDQEKNGGAKAKSKKGQKSKTQKAKGLKKGTRSSGPVPDIDDPTRRDELMIELNKVLDPMKDDFIVAKLRPVCKTCKETIATEVWCAAVEKPYCLCNECYEARQLKTKASERVVFKKTHEALGAIDDPDTKTEKSIDDFDTRQAFLQLCQLNHYQYDFLRRAKHSSMMVLYHLHNPDAPNFVSQCQYCHQDITSGIRWNCKVSGRHGGQREGWIAHSLLRAARPQPLRLTHSFHPPARSTLVVCAMLLLGATRPATTTCATRVGHA